jgi:hypothetical protein
MKQRKANFSKPTAPENKLENIAGSWRCSDP